MYKNIHIPTFVINLENRKDRLIHVLEQFDSRTEFDLKIISARKHKIGAVGLWENIKEAVKEGNKQNDDVIIICEDDHVFTQDYHRDYLISNIIQGNQVGADILLGGIGGYGKGMFISENLVLIDWFFSTHFLVIYKRFFDTILTSDFQDSDVADAKISKLTDKKYSFYPFLSIQKDFGYSDVTSVNEENGFIDRLFEESNKRLKTDKITNNRSYIFK